MRVNRSYALPGESRDPDGARFAHRLVNEDYASGPLLVESLHALARAGWSMDALARWVQPWVALLKSNLVAGAARNLPPQFIDCTPFNCVLSASGKLAYIDAEWSAAEPCVERVFIRGLAYSLGDCLQPGEPKSDRRSIVVCAG